MKQIRSLSEFIWCPKLHDFTLTSSKLLCVLAHLCSFDMFQEVQLTEDQISGKHTFTSYFQIWQSSNRI